MSKQWPVLLVYFLLGVFAVCAQALLLRETQVVLFGSELSWGLVLAFWLAGVALGAQTSGRLCSSLHRSLRILSAANIAMPAILAAEVSFLRSSRILLGTSPGEYIGPGGMLLLAAAATVPVSMWIGLAFPAASNLLGGAQEKTTERARSVGFVYLAEASGSLLGGVLFSFVLVTTLDPFSIIFSGGAIVALATAHLVRRVGQSKAMPAFVWLWAVALSALVFSGASSSLEKNTTRLRWRSFARGLDLVATEDSRYQNIAVGKLEDQYSLYTNGTVAATWPDHTRLAVEAHLAACMHPHPRRMLVLGGGAEGFLKELLGHNPERLDYVTLDGLEQELVVGFLDEADKAALADPRVHVHVTDARRFVKQAASAATARYDLIVLAASEPTSAFLARLYTGEFFAELSRVMSEDGLLALTLTGSVGPWSSEVAEYVGSVVTPLEQVFAQVLLTFSDPVHVFAAKQRDVIAEGGDVLAARFRSSNVRSPYFDPLWFEGASDLLEPEKLRLVQRALRDNPPRHINTDAHPVAPIYRLLLWQSTTGSAHRGESQPAGRRSSLLSSVLDIRLSWVNAAIFLCTLMGAAVGLARGKNGLRRTAILWSVGTTGFAVMAIEIVLLYTFQVLYGYVYGMIGLVIGIFMFGLVVGGTLMNRHLGTRATDSLQTHFSGGRRGPSGLVTVLVLDAALALFALALFPLLTLLSQLSVEWLVQTTVFCLVAAAGVLGGLLFPLAAYVRLQDRAATARVAGVIDATDHVGGSLGALVTGVILVPVLGIAGTCMTVTAMKLLSFLLVAASIAANRRGLVSR